ncbi:MAG TPA: UDP-N-acetylmuramoyl-L-alanyl-D-glutamate--2,6-diaminopimelate ligase, partial [Opitutales bacterium]|nr:UDP-N-acetylmuramoyl-L-alanyl-D-glutamate--2,6-diaminopimelate ligase [Opitutales bacterium]
MIGHADLPISLLLTAASSRYHYASQSKDRVSNNPYKVSGRPSVENLFEGIDCKAKHLDNETVVTCLITDSRRVVPGALFFAIGGLRTNGNYFVEEAVDRGAVAIVTEEDLGARFPIDFIQVKDARKALALVSRRFYDAPDERLRITGVTGTNGKTTVTMLTQHLIGGSDEVGLIGTIRYDLGKRTLPSFRTTPESVDIYSLLDQMVKNGCSESVMEISSHGIAQQRTYGLDVDVAAFLNLTQDHIDYHKSMEAYFGVKKRLFTGEMGRKPKAAVVNADCSYGRKLIAELGEASPVTTFAIDSEADVRAREVKLFPDRTEFKLAWPEGELEVTSPLLGRFNVSNVLAALTIGYVQGRAPAELLERLATFPGVPGRMERIDEGQDYNLLVDYAHTDDALTHACGMLREITPGKLIVVFGCGGDRDRTKRAPMLKAVLKGADVVYATADNPRSEALDQIFADMRAVRGSESVQFIADRKDAISRALDAA